MKNEVRIAKGTIKESLKRVFLVILKTQIFFETFQIFLKCFKKKLFQRILIWQYIQRALKQNGRTMTKTISLSLTWN